MNENKKSYYAIIPANVRYDESLTPNAKLLYGEITALCNEKGYCWAGNSYFANLYGVSNKSVSNWINQLVDRGYLTSEMNYKEGSKEVLNRYLRIATPMEENFHTYGRKVHDPMEEKVKDNNTTNNTLNNTSNNKSKTDSKLSDTDLKDDFEELWKIYPNKKGKQKAFTSYKKAIKEGTAKEAIKQGIESYNQEIDLKRTEKRFIKHGSTWFSNKGWEDEYDTGKQVDKEPDMDWLSTDNIFG